MNDPGNNGNSIVVTFPVVSINPIEEIEGPVRTEGKKVVRRDALRLAGFAHHKQLRQNSDRFQINAERPQNLQDAN